MNADQFMLIKISILHDSAAVAVANESVAYGTLVSDHDIRAHLLRVMFFFATERMSRYREQHNASSEAIGQHVVVLSQLHLETGGGPACSLSDWAHSPYAWLFVTKRHGTPLSTFCYILGNSTT